MFHLIEFEEACNFGGTQRYVAEPKSKQVIISAWFLWDTQSWNLY